MSAAPPPVDYQALCNAFSSVQQLAWSGGGADTDTEMELDCLIADHYDQLVSTTGLFSVDFIPMFAT
jgi:hypothetical protein